MKNNISSDQLTKSLNRRIKHTMIQVLEKFEDAFPDLDNSRDGQIFKADLRNIFNDVIRCQRDELRDYDIEYRPMRLDQYDNILSLSREFLETVQKIEFDINNNVPYIKIYSSFDKKRVLEAIRAELNAGAIYEFDSGLILGIVGIDSCINSVLVFMDRYRLHSSVRPKYQEWRSKVINLYIGARDDRKNI